MTFLHHFHQLKQHPSRQEHSHRTCLSPNAGQPISRAHGSREVSPPNGDKVKAANPPPQPRRQISETSSLHLKECEHAAPVHGMGSKGVASTQKGTLLVVLAVTHMLCIRK